MYSCSPNPCGDIYLRKPNPYIEEVRTYLRTGDGDRETDQFYTGRCANYTEGKLRSIQQYKDGLDHGKWVFYYESGEIETSQLVNAYKASIVLSGEIPDGR